MREFDLNIERVLENWTVAHALREVIANALDEQAFSDSPEPSIYEDNDGAWHIRDWGRGLRYDHLTLKESKEKLAHPEAVIGKFGVGLKDALATFDRHRIGVTIRSRHDEITTGKHPKHGFADVKTLHALISEPSDPAFVGTEFVLTGKALTRIQVEEAQGLFLRYSGDQLVGASRYGTIHARRAGGSRIYVNGLRVATEDNFLFSYNITSPTKALRQALNRERSNVGRGAYTDRVKAILLACEAADVIEALVEDLQGFQHGKQHDETGWLDVGVHACRQLNARRKVIFLTTSQLMTAPDLVRFAENDGHRAVVVPDTVAAKLRDLCDAAGNPIRDLDQYRREWDDSFQFSFVDPVDLTKAETRVWDSLAEIFAARGGQPKGIREVRISETMRLMEGHYQEAVGVWEGDEGRIVVKRDQLSSFKAFAGTVLHEVAHAVSGAPDVNLRFEEELTRHLGIVTARHLAHRA